MKALYQSRSLWHKKVIVQDEGQAPYVLTTFWRQRDAVAMADVLQQAQAQGIALQPLLAQGRDWPWFWVRSGFVAGEAMAGPYLRGPHVQAFARTLAGLHGLRSPRFGPALHPSLDWGRTPQERVLARCRWALHRSRVEQGIKADLLQWLRGQGPVLADAREFSLTHGDLKSGNMIWCPDDGRAYLIDYGNMSYHWAELELAALLQGRLRHPRLQQVLLETYLSLCPAEVARRWERHAQAFQVLQLLLSAYRRWVQWRFPLFPRADTPGAAQRLQDLNAFVLRAHALASEARA
jgi:Ser/Thr protein kinase RdoA (MazF antagonist)